jgi:hypothetical protein
MMNDDILVKNIKWQEYKRVSNRERKIKNVICRIYRY